MHPERLTIRRAHRKADSNLFIILVHLFTFRIRRETEKSSFYAKLLLKRLHTGANLLVFLSSFALLGILIFALFLGEFLFIGIENVTYDDEHGYFIDEQGEPLKIQCRRSFMANIIQSDDETVKSFYSELKNYVLSFKGVKSRMSWRYEAFKRGRDQLLRVKIRGKSICLYCALDPEQFDKSKYFHTALDSKMFECVPMLVKIKSARGLKRALQLVDAVMEKFGIEPNPKATKIDYVAAHPYEKTKALVENGLIKILDSEYIIVDHK